MKTEKTLREEIKVKSDALHQVFTEAGTDIDMDKVKCIEGDSTAKVAKVGAMEKELEDLHKEFETISALKHARQAADDGAKLATEPDLRGNPAPAAKTIGQLIMKSGALKAEHNPVMLDVDPKSTLLDAEAKANFFTTSGWAPENLRMPGFVGSPTRPIAVIDRIPIYPTTQNSVVYMLESTFTNSAAEKAEGDAAAESALALTATTDEVEEIGTFVPVSKVQLEDVPMAEAYLTNRLTFMVRQKLDKQILEGSGSSPSLMGTLHLAALQAQAKGSDPTPDAIYKAFDLVRTVGFTEPSDLFINPTDWQDIRLLRTADGIYIFGNPTDTGPTRMWGVPVTITTAVTVNTALCGDYANFSFLAMRRGVEVEMSSGYSDYFVKGKLAVLATLRCAMVHTRITAFAKITGI